MADERPILVTGAGGGVGGVGRTVVSLLRESGRPVRAMVHHDDDRARALRTDGAEVVAGDLTQPGDVARALDGCGRMLFCMGVSADYLEASVVVAAVARSLGTLEVLVNLSQMTVSQMTLRSAEESRQQRLHWLAEQVLDWSGLPVVDVRPTIFLENPLLSTIAARSVAERGVLALPFGTGRSSPVAAADVARVIATILLDPRPHLGKVYELTGPRSQDMTGVAGELSRALGRPVTYEDVPHEVWVEEALAPAGLPPHTRAHLETMARLHRENRYDRRTDTVESLTGRPAQSVEAFVADRADRFGQPGA